MAYIFTYNHSNNYWIYHSYWFTLYNLMISSTPWLWSSFLVISSIICATLMWRYLKHKLLQKVFYTSILFLTSLIVFGMPLFKILYNNPAYEKASSEVFPSNFPTYSYGEIAPEILWNFGRTAPTLTAKHLQELNRSPFGVLVRPSLSTDFELTISKHLL